jgi:hypothetical protein
VGKPENRRSDYPKGQISRDKLNGGRDGATRETGTEDKIEGNVGQKKEEENKGSIIYIIGA